MEWPDRTEALLFPSRQPAAWRPRSLDNPSLQETLCENLGVRTRLSEYSIQQLRPASSPCPLPEKFSGSASVRKTPCRGIRSPCLKSPWPAEPHVETVWEPPPKSSSPRRCRAGRWLCALSGLRGHHPLAHRGVVGSGSWAAARGQKRCCKPRRRRASSIC